MLESLINDLLEALPTALKWHIVLALATAVVCGIAVTYMANPPLTPPKAMIAGALLLYPLLAVCWLGGGAALRAIFRKPG
jgi:hypothetical protein